VKVSKQKGASVDQSVVEMRTVLARKIAERAVAQGDTLTEIPGLRLYRRSAPTACISATYEPPHPPAFTSRWTIWDPPNLPLLISHLADPTLHESVYLSLSTRGDNFRFPLIRKLS
jgi:hypothetical protein